MAVGFSESAEHQLHMAHPPAPPPFTGHGDGDLIIVNPDTGPYTFTSNLPHTSIIGTHGDDVFVPMADGDYITGNGGNDTFVFHQGVGYETITDYHQGDHIRFVQPGVPVDTLQFRSAPGGLDVPFGPSMTHGLIHLTGLTQADAGWVHDRFIFAWTGRLNGPGSDPPGRSQFRARR